MALRLRGFCFVQKIVNDGLESGVGVAVADRTAPVLIRAIRKIIVLKAIRGKLDGKTQTILGWRVLKVIGSEEPRGRPCALCGIGRIGNQEIIVKASCMIPVPVKNTRANGFPKIGAARFVRDRHGVKDNTTNTDLLLHIQQGVSDLIDKNIFLPLIEEIKEIQNEKENKEIVQITRRCQEPECELGKCKQRKR